MAILLDNHVAAHPDRAALVDELGTTTWAELRTRVTRLSRAMADRGLGSVDTIAVMMGNRREIYEILLAAAHTGFTVVPVNWHWVADELAYVIEDSGARALLVAQARLPPVGPPGAQRPSQRGDSGQGAAGRLKGVGGSQHAPRE